MLLGTFVVVSALWPVERMLDGFQRKRPVPVTVSTWRILNLPAGNVTKPSGPDSALAFAIAFLSPQSIAWDEPPIGSNHIADGDPQRLKESSRLIVLAGAVKRHAVRLDADGRGEILDHENVGIGYHVINLHVTFS